MENLQTFKTFINESDTSLGYINPDDIERMDIKWTISVQDYEHPIKDLHRSNGKKYIAKSKYGIIEIWFGSDSDLNVISSIRVTVEDSLYTQELGSRDKAQKALLSNFLNEGNLNYIALFLQKTYNIDYKPIKIKSKFIHAYYDNTEAFFEKVNN